MQSTYQYRVYLDTIQKLELNHWLRVCRYWYNRQLGDGFDWWKMNRTYVNACPLVSSIAAVREQPNFFGQKKTLPVIKQDLVRVIHSGELLDFRRVDSTVLQDVCKRVELAFSRFIKGDGNGNRSGRPRFKTEADYKTMVFATAKDEVLGILACNSGFQMQKSLNPRRFPVACLTSTSLILMQTRSTERSGERTLNIFLSYSHCIKVCIS